MDEPGRVRVERSGKRVRVMLGGKVVADSTGPYLVWELPYYPTYFFPADSVVSDSLATTGETTHSPSLGEGTRYRVVAGGAEGSAFSYPDCGIPELSGCVAFEWDTMDHWFEEDEEVYVHPRNPYTRIDVLRSGRRVRVEIDGITVADSENASFLFETGLPTRYYLPKTDVRMDLLVPTDRVTACPYKGTARYWSVTIDGTTHEDIVWGYDTPLSESQGIAGMVSFYNEKVDIYIDGELQERPGSPFS